MSDAKNIKALENSSVELTLTLPAARIEEDYQKSLAKYVKNAQIPGFRKGHVPASVLEKKFGESLRTETTFDTMEAFLKEELEKLDDAHKPLPYCTPVLQDEEKLLPFKKDTDVTFSVKYDVKPQFELPQYTGMQLTIPNVKVTDADVTKELDKLREQNAMIIDKKDGTAQDGDIVNIDYVELDKDGSEIKASERKDFTFTLGTGYNYYEIDKDVEGMKVGETKTFTKAYPKEFKTADLAGKTVKEEYKTVADLTKATREKLEKQLADKIADDKFDKIADEIAKNVKIDLPQSMIDLELDRDWSNYIRQTGLSEDQVLKFLSFQKKDKATIQNEWKADAEKTLRVQLVMDKIKEKENFTVSEEELEKAEKEHLKDISDENQKKYYRTLLEEDLKFNKVSDFLEANNTFTPGEEMSFDAYVNGQAEPEATK